MVTLNATPESLWNLFKTKSKDATDAHRLKPLMSTMEDKHGSVASHTEMPRATLVSALKSQSDLFSTQSLQGRTFYHDTAITFEGSTTRSTKPRANVRREKVRA
jgi:hypothetical protein